MKTIDYLKFKSVNGPYNDQVFMYDDFVVFKNEIIRESGANFALQFGKFDLGVYESCLDKHGISPHVVEVYTNNAVEFMQKNGEWKETDNTTWLGIDAKRLKRFVRKMPVDFEMVAVKTDEQFEVLREISGEGFLTKTPENPYDSYDDSAYCDALKHNIRNQKTEVVHAFLFRKISTGEFVGMLDATINGGTCFVSGFTILPKFRHSTAFNAVRLFVDYIVRCKITNLFCTTKTGGYPQRLYENLGMKPFCRSVQFTRQGASV